MAFSSVFSATQLPRRWALVGVTLASSLLTACYVVPVNRNPPPAVVYVAPAAQAPSSVTFAARLYPANDIASTYGVINAVVTNDLNRGGYINCNYQMNTTTLGTGQCKLSNGALFTMHVGS